MAETETRRWRLRWGPLLASAALAAAIGFVGDLAGGFLMMLEPEGAGGFTWLGGLVVLGVLLAALFAGGRLVVRLAGGLDREEAALHGLLVWALVTLAAAAEFVALGAGPAVVGATDGQLRLVLGGAAVGLAAGAIAATAGSLSARPAPFAGWFAGRERRAGGEAPRAATTGPYPPPADRPGTYPPSADRPGTGPERRPPPGSIPPGLH